MIGLLVGAALAGPDIALVPLDATPPAASADLELAVRGIAAALQKDGRLVPLYDDELALRLGATAEERLRSARESLSEGRRMLADDLPDVAVTFLQESVAAHTEAGSDVVRRDEAADAHYALARAAMATGDRTLAAAEIRRAVQLVPDYMDVRADAVTTELDALADEAVAGLRSRPPRKISAAGAAALAVGFGVELLVHGAVDAEGDLALSVQSGPDPLYVVERPGPFDPPAIGDPWYDAIADQIAAAALGETIPTWTPPKTTPPTVGEPPVVERPRRSNVAVWVTAGVLVAGGAGATAWFLAPAPEPPTSVWSLTVE